MVKLSKKTFSPKKKKFFNKLIGTAKKPRFSVFRSHNHIYAQLIDDLALKTIVSSSTLESTIKNHVKSAKTKDAAFLVGKLIGQKATFKGISNCIFDRGHKPYHGRIESLAAGARAEGMHF